MVLAMLSSSLSANSDSRERDAETGRDACTAAERSGINVVYDCWPLDGRRFSSEDTWSLRNRMSTKLSVTAHTSKVDDVERRATACAKAAASSVALKRKTVSPSYRAAA